MQDRFGYALVGLVSLFISAMMIIIGFGLRTHVECSRAASGTVSCRVEQRVFNAFPWGEPTLAEAVDEVVADEVCDTYFDDEGDLETTCTWAVIFRGAGDAVQARNFGQNAAQSTAAELTTYLNSDAETYTTASQNVGRIVLGGIVGPITFLFGAAFAWQAIKPPS